MGGYSQSSCAECLRINVRTAQYVRGVCPDKPFKLRRWGATMALNGLVAVGPPSAPRQSRKRKTMQVNGIDAFQNCFLTDSGESAGALTK